MGEVRDAALPRDPSATRLGQRLRRARLARNLTQSEVAQQSFSVSYISAVERGQIRPSLGALERLADRLQVPLSELLSTDDTLQIPAASVAERIETTTSRPEIDDRLRQAQLRLRQGNAQQALDMLRKVESQRLSEREQALVLWHQAVAQQELGASEDARAAIQRAIPLAEKAGDAELRERLRNELGNIQASMHRFQLALDQYRGNLDAIEKGVISDPTFRLSVLYNTGNAYWELGEYRDAIEYLGRAATYAQDVLSPARLATIYAQLSHTYADQGDTRRAAVYATRGIAAYEEADNERLTARVYNRLGRAYTQDNQPGEALVYLRKAREMAERQNDPRALSEAERSLATLYIQQQQVDQAAEAVNQAITLAAASNDPAEQAQAMLARAQVREAQGDNNGAGQDYDEAIRLLDQTDATHLLGDAYAQYSAFLERRGESKRALDYLKHAWQLRERGVPAF